MKNHYIHSWRSILALIHNPNGSKLKDSVSERVLSSATFVIVIICLGLWITFFLLLKDQLVTETISGISLTNLTCLIFFGGMVIAIIVGALAGNLLRRIFWKRQTHIRKR
jgi:hypothetical protein